MPVVRASRTVSRSALPGARLTAAETATSQGVDVARARSERALALGGVAGNVAGRLADVFGRQVQQERDHADRVARLKWQTQMDEWYTEHVENPETGALSVRGEPSFALPERLDDQLASFAGELGAGLSTEEQRLAFAADTHEFRQRVALTVRRHVRDEMQQFEAGLLTSRLENLTNSAVANYKDVPQVGEDLQAGVDAIRTSGADLGLSGDEIDQQVGAFRTSIHTGVIGRMLDNGEDRAARVYYEETEGQIDGEARARVEAALEEGTNRRIAQETTDEILAAGGTLADMRARVKALDLEPAVRDDVLSRVEHEQVILDRAEQDRVEQTMRSAGNILDQTNGNVSRIPPSVWSTLTPAQKSSLRAYGRQIQDGGEVTTDLPTYYGLQRLAMNDPDEFFEVDLTSYIDKIGRTEFKELTDIQFMIRNGQRNAAAQRLEGFSTRTQVLDAALAEWGINPDADATSPEGIAIGHLQQLLDARVEALGGMDNVDNTRLRAEMDAILSATVQSPPSWWQRALGIQPTTPVIHVTIEDVPDIDRQGIADSLRRQGIVPTDAGIAAVYREILLQEAGGAGSP